MPSIKRCTSCGLVRTIRRRCGRCDTCWRREEYMTRPGVAAAARARAKRWKINNKPQVKIYNHDYYQSRKST